MKQMFVRSQHSAGSSSGGFGGPDTYVAVVSGPEPLPAYTPLQRDRLQRKGYTVEWIGEGYREHTGPRSSLGKAIARAESIVTGE
jgi:hypothetical protein